MGEVCGAMMAMCASTFWAARALRTSRQRPAEHHGFCEHTSYPQAHSCGLVGCICIVVHYPNRLVVVVLCKVGSWPACDAPSYLVCTRCNKVTHMYSIASNGRKPRTVT